MIATAEEALIFKSAVAIQHRQAAEWTEARNGCNHWWLSLQPSVFIIINVMITRCVASTTMKRWTCINQYQLLWMMQLQSTMNNFTTIIDFWLFNSFARFCAQLGASCTGLRCCHSQAEAADFTQFDGVSVAMVLPPKCWSFDRKKVNFGCFHGSTIDGHTKII